MNAFRELIILIRIVSSLNEMVSKSKHNHKMYIVLTFI